MTVDTRWWHTHEDKVVCTLCPRECHIPKDSRGFCFVRANEGGQLKLTTDGRSSGFCIDPIEKKPLNHFLPGTPVLSFGTAGCNLGCKFCQNWDISKSREMDRLAATATPESIVAAAKAHGCRSLAFTYNDPVIWAEYAIEVAKVARRENIKTVAVTAGYISDEPRKEFFHWMDAANVDLKAFTETFYRSLTQTHLGPVLDTLKYIKHETNVWLEITTLLIPGENDSPEETKQMCAWLVEHLGPDVPLHFSAFHPDFKMRDKPDTPHETLILARQIALDAGIEYVYVGNVYDQQRQSTYCPSCQATLIQRDWYELGQCNMSQNKCGQCGHTIAGVFEQTMGQWGRKRQPVSIEHVEPIALTIHQEILQANAAGQEAKAYAAGGQAPGVSQESTQEENRGAGQATSVAAISQTHATHAMANATFVTSTDVALCNETHASNHSDQPDRENPPATSSPGFSGSSGFSDSSDSLHLAPSLTLDQIDTLLKYARCLVKMKVTGQKKTVILPPAIESLPIQGLFISLYHNQRLRSCRGRYLEIADASNNQSSPTTHTLGYLLKAVANDVVQGDSRFVSICADELSYLTIEVSLLDQFKKITQTGEDRTQAIELGTHGLILWHPLGKQSCLLPEIATANKWDAKLFLDGLCRQAGLGPDTWRRDDNTQIHAFKTCLLTSPAPEAGFDHLQLNALHLQILIDIANNLLRDEPDPGKLDPLLGIIHSQELGLHFYTATGRTATAIGRGHSLLELVRIAMGSLQDLCTSKKTEPSPIKRVILLYNPITLSSKDDQARFASLSAYAILARGGGGGGKWSLTLPATLSILPAAKPHADAQAPDQVSQALTSLQMTEKNWHDAQCRLTGFEVISFETRQRPSGCIVRQPARAGLFYPADPHQMRLAVAGYLSEPATKNQRRMVGGDGPGHHGGSNGGHEPVAVRAVMLPHAGWQYCGHVIGKTLLQTKVPDTVILLGPKHTPYGANLSVAPHQKWDIPGAGIAIAQDLADYLVKTVPGLKCEPDAHRMEHGSEVLLPFLHHLNPQVTVLPIVVGQLRYEALDALAQSLANIIAKAQSLGEQPPFLVISSDMNHFANEQENRRRDDLAINAMCTGDPRRLYDTCVDNQISMCGLLPACIVMQTLLKQNQPLKPQWVDYTNSASISGDSSRVVGYAGILL